MSNIAIRSSKTEKYPMTKVGLEWVEKRMEGNQVEQKSGCGSKKDNFLKMGKT